MMKMPKTSRCLALQVKTFPCFRTPLSLVIKSSFATGTKVFDRKETGEESVYFKHQDMEILHQMKEKRRAKKTVERTSELKNVLG